MISWVSPVMCNLYLSKQSEKTVCIKYNINFTHFYFAVDRTSHLDYSFADKMDFEFGSFSFLNRGDHVANYGTRKVKQKRSTIHCNRVKPHISLIPFCKSFSLANRGRASQVQCSIVTPQTMPIFEVNVTAPSHDLERVWESCRSYDFRALRITKFYLELRAYGSKRPPPPPRPPRPPPR